MGIHNYLDILKGKIINFVNLTVILSTRHPYRLIFFMLLISFWICKPLINSEIKTSKDTFKDQNIHVNKVKGEKPTWLVAETVVYIYEIIVFQTIIEESTVNDEMYQIYEHFFEINQILHDILDTRVITKNPCFIMPDSTTDEELLLERRKPLIISPTNMWNNNIEFFKSDKNISETIELFNSKKKLCKLAEFISIPIEISNIKIKNITVKSYASSVIFGIKNIESFKNIFINQLSKNFSLKENNEQILYTFYENGSKSYDTFNKIVVYIFFVLYTILSMRKIQKHSMFLAICAILTVCLSFCISVSILHHIGFKFTIYLHIIFPYLIIGIGLDKRILYVRTIQNLPKHVPINSRMKRAIVTQCWYIIREFIIQSSIYLCGVASLHPKLQEYSAVAYIMEWTDLFVQHFIFVPLMTLYIGKNPIKEDNEIVHKNQYPIHFYGYDESIFDKDKNKVVYVPPKNRINSISNKFQTSKFGEFISIIIRILKIAIIASIIALTLLHYNIIGNKQFVAQDFEQNLDDHIDRSYKYGYSKPLHTYNWKMLFNEYRIDVTDKFIGFLPSSMMYIGNKDKLSKLDTIIRDKRQFYEKYRLSSVIDMRRYDHLADKIYSQMIKNEITLLIYNKIMSIVFFFALWIFFWVTYYRIKKIITIKGIGVFNYTISKCDLFKHSYTTQVKSNQYYVVSVDNCNIVHIWNIDQHVVYNDRNIFQDITSNIYFQINDFKESECIWAFDITQFYLVLGCMSGTIYILTLNKFINTCRIVSKHSKHKSSIVMINITSDRLMDLPYKSFKRYYLINQFSLVVIRIDGCLQHFRILHNMELLELYESRLFGNIPVYVQVKNNHCILSDTYHNTTIFNYKKPQFEYTINRSFSVVQSDISEHPYIAALVFSDKKIIVVEVETSKHLYVKFWYTEIEKIYIHKKYLIIQTKSQNISVLDYLRGQIKLHLTMDKYYVQYIKNGNIYALTLYGLVQIKIKEKKTTTLLNIAINSEYEHFKQNNIKKYNYTHILKLNRPELIIIGINSI
ncbi:hypothetical protein A3Q56_01113 [Intoshia linei]|uniref:SSD domain-containing protein n=1 Tax=Intoshia linei TaxID=1819745 RepID=A0A177B9Z2_9BILA|nr:hypothetical protein A3Q56_01113 [Intoshia linei]